MKPALSTILSEIVTERARQDELHPWDKLEIGVTNYSKQFHATEANELKRLNDKQESDGYAYIDTLILEEYHETFAETDPVKQETEAIQLAALAIKFVEWSRAKRGAKC